MANRRQWRECVDHALEVRGVSLRFGGVRALTDISFGVNDGELFSIIGPNGAGKTSIVNCISCRYRPTEGQLFYRGRDITTLNPNARPRLGIGRTFQNLALFHHMSGLDNIIEEFGMTVMMIEQDMGVVMDISHRVMVLDFGRKIAEGDPAAVLADPHVKRAYLGEEDEVLVDPDETPAPAETAV